MSTTYRPRSGYQRRTITAGPVSKVNARPGECRLCREEIPAGGGQLYRLASGAWAVQHWPAERGGWLMHPEPYRGGCPAGTDEMNAQLFAHGSLGPDAQPPVSERKRIASAAASYAERQEREREHYGYTSNGRRRCEDAPCCGCCD